MQPESTGVVPRAAACEPYVAAYPSDPLNLERLPREL